MRGARPLNDPEVQQILDEGFTSKYHHRNRSLFAIGISTGFRVSELLALQMRDVIHRKYPKDWIALDRRHTKGKTQGRTNRLMDFAKKTLQPWINARLANAELAELLDEPVFISREVDTRTRQIQPISLRRAGMILAEAYELCGITGSVSTHSMRKTFAKKAYQDAIEKFQAGKMMKEPIFVVRDLLGHKHIQTTLRYLSFLGSELSEDVFSYQVDTAD
jgi:integrase